MARSSAGSRDGSEAITLPGCPLAGHQDLLVVDIFRNCFRSHAARREAGSIPSILWRKGMMMQMDTATPAGAAL
jgi:hypothetical protein